MNNFKVNEITTKSPFFCEMNHRIKDCRDSLLTHEYCFVAVIGVNKMKTNSYFKEGVFFVALITVMIVSAVVGIVSLASASSNDIHKASIYKKSIFNKHMNSQSKLRYGVDYKKYGRYDSIHLAKVSIAIENYRQAINKSSQATTSVMAVYWKIEAADSLSANIQYHLNAIKPMLNIDGDALQKLAKPKNISALADRVFGVNSNEKQDRKNQMNEILDSIELSLLVNH